MPSWVEPVLNCKHAFKCPSTKSCEKVRIKRKEKEKENHERKSSAFGCKTLGKNKIYKIKLSIAPQQNSTDKNWKR